jgi:tRNA A-37 threonylcarbamoyl transferase component Bud32
VSRQADTSAGGGLTRAALAGAAAQVLKDEGPGAARVVRYELPDGPVVLKEWIPPERHRLLGVWARLIMRREIRDYRLLDGTPGVPRYRGHEGDTALYMQFVDGQPIHRLMPTDLLRAGLESLEHTLEALHGRRFAHLDLHQKLNALIDADGRAWVIDLGQGLDCSRGLLRALLFPVLVKVDRHALLKFRARYAPETLPAAERDRLVARYGIRRDRWPKRFGRRLRRLVIGEG